MTTKHHIYDINVLDCYRELINRTLIDPTFNPPIDKITYYYRLRTSVVIFARLKGFQSDYSYFVKKELFFIDQEQEGFDNWLGFKLSISEKHEVKLMLDHYFRNSSKPKQKFINGIEYNLLPIMKNGVFHDIKEIKSEITSWIREQNEKLMQDDISENSNYDESYHFINPKPLDYNKENEQSIEEFVDLFAPFEWLKNNKLLIDNSNIDVIDDRIDIKLSFDEIKKYFIALNRIDKNRTHYMSEEDVEYLIKSNFKVGEKIARKHFKVDLPLNVLMKFIYEFYLKVDTQKYSGKQKEYCGFLINNFEGFRNHDINILSGKLSSAKPKKYPLG